MHNHYITGYVYFIQAGDEPIVKIGTTIEPLSKRLLSLQTANHKPLKLVGAIDLRKLKMTAPLNRVQFSQVAKRKEAEIHALFSHLRIQGEWFSLTDEILYFIREHSNVDTAST